MRVNSWVVIVLIGVLCSSFVFATDVDSAVIDSFEDNNEVPVIIILEDTAETLSEDLEEVQNAVETKQENVLKELDLDEKKGFLGMFNNEPGFELEHRYTTINALSGVITVEGLEKLYDNPNVESIEYNYPIKPLLDGSAPLINANDVWNLSFNGTLIDGTGQTVCVIDTGVDYTHPALGGCTLEDFVAGTCTKVIAGYDFGDDDNDPVDVHSHGTHVAGTVASKDGTYRGVAPGASIAAVKVFSDAGSGSTADAISAIDWCVTNADEYNISVITMSIGVVDNDGNEVPHLDYCDNDDILAAKASWAVSQGLFVDVSSGNTLGSSGITSPACGINVTSVGSVSESDEISGFNTAPILRVIAPGSSITSTVLGGNFGTKGGTSMSAPHVAGAAALIQQFNMVVHNTLLSPLEIMDILNLTGKRIYDSRNSLYFSRIDPFAAIISLDTISPSINFVSPTPDTGSDVTDSSMFINITSDETLQNVILEWNGINETMNGSGTTFYSHKTNLTSGTYTFSVHGYDFANHSDVTEERIITVNVTEETEEETSIGPEIITIIPLNNSYFNTSFNLNISVRDSNLSFSNYSITNSSEDIVQMNSTDINTTPFLWTDFVDVIDGEYTLNVAGTNSENYSTTETIIFIIDTINPEIESLHVTPDTIYNDNDVFFTVVITDENLNKSTLFLESNVSGEMVNYMLNVETGDMYNFTLVSAGNFTNQQNVSYTFHATDNAGNTKTSETFSFIVENRDVSFVNISVPDNGTIVEVGTFVQFNSTATDPDNDVMTYSWNFGDGTMSTEQNPVKQFNETGTYSVLVNVSDLYSSLTSDVTITVSDTESPLITSITYDTELHLEEDGSIQNIDVTVSDYSGISNTSLYFTDVSQNRSCSDQNSTYWTCSWNLNDLTVGDYSFVVNATDNSSSLYANTSTYTFLVISCSDETQNGNEEGVDCGGSCSACPESSSSDSGSSSGGSSGGGGGGSSSSSNTATTIEEIIEVDEVDENIVDNNVDDDEVNVNLQMQQDNIEEVVVDEEIEQETESSNALTGAAVFQTVRSVAFKPLTLVLFGASIFSIFGTTIYVKKKKRDRAFINNH